jgi:hypothetical protein
VDPSLALEWVESKRCRLEEVNAAMKTMKVKVPDWYPGYAVVPYYALYPYYYPWYGYYVWPY